MASLLGYYTVLFLIWQSSGLLHCAVPELAVFWVITLCCSRVGSLLGYYTVMFPSWQSFGLLHCDVSEKGNLGYYVVIFLR